MLGTSHWKIRIHTHTHTHVTAGVSGYIIDLDYAFSTLWMAPRDLE